MGMGQPQVGRAAALSANAKSLAFLLLLTLALLLPFLNKPLHVDDPMYVWTAKQIVEHPSDFYGTDVNWCLVKRPMALANDNPPLTSYWLAAVGSLFGWRESVLHAAMLVPALFAIAGVSLLAVRLGASPLVAGLALLAMPGFLVSSTTLMADVLATALWTWAVLAWVRGLQEQRTGWLAAGALLAGLCMLTKFVGLALLPLFLAYTLLRIRRLDGRILLLGVPLALALVYRARMLARYGVDPFDLIGTTALGERKTAKASAADLPWLGLAYLGGACLPALPLAGWILRRRDLALCAVTMLAVGAVLLLSPSFAGYSLRIEEGTRLSLVLHLSAFITCGAIVLVLVLRRGLRERSAEAILLGLWIVGILLFGSLLNWTTNIRSLIPATPAVAIVLASEMTLQKCRRREWIPITLLGFSVLAGLLVAQGDLAYARSAREAARTVTQEHGEGSGRLWFSGSWGFQYYMDLEGASKISLDHFQLSPGDTIVVPSSNTCVAIISPAMDVPAKRYTFPLRAVASTITGGAGFYSNILGVVPYVFGFPPEEVYYVSYLHANISDRMGHWSR
jgi:4-amino-4-deoxy-L-arabinose transferase-like glycosyltransferase